MNTLSDCRMNLRWFLLKDRQKKQRLITPLPEAPGQGVPGMVRYKDAHGCQGFIDQLWFRDNAKRLSVEEVKAQLPVMSANECQRHFGNLIIQRAEPARRAEPVAKRPSKKASPGRSPTKKRAAKKTGAAVEVVVLPRRPRYPAS